MKRRDFLFATVSTAALSACGGSGGEATAPVGEAPPPVSPPPATPPASAPSPATAPVPPPANPPADVPAPPPPPPPAPAPAPPPSVATPAWTPAPGELRIVPTTNTFLSLRAGQLPDWEYKFYTIIDSFSGGVYDPYWGTYGAMLFHGGGHASTYDNSVLMLDYNDLTFKRLSNASPPTAFTDVMDDPLFNQETGEFGDGQPGSGHSFDMLAILPPSDGGAAAGSLLRVSGQGVHYRMSRSNNWAHRFDITPTMAEGTRGKWVRATENAPTGYKTPGACTAYDGTRKGVWWISNLSSQPPLIRYLDVPARAQRTVFFADDTRVAPLSHSDAMSMRYHAPLDIVILSCSTIYITFAMAWLDCKNPEAGWNRVTLSAQVPTLRGHSHPFDYVPEIDRYVMLSPGDGGAVYEIQVPADPASMWTVTRRTFTGLTTIPRSYTTGKRWSYAPAVKAFVWQARHSTPLHVYRPLGT